jgi:hypothetical protein
MHSHAERGNDHTINREQARSHKVIALVKKKPRKKGAKKGAAVILWDACPSHDKPSPQSA